MMRIMMPAHLTRDGVMEAGRGSLEKLEGESPSACCVCCKMAGVVVRRKRRRKRRRKPSFLFKFIIKLVLVSAPMSQCVRVFSERSNLKHHVVHATSRA